MHYVLDHLPVIEVLDHGYVKFIESMGRDESIIEAARMSTGKGFENWEKDFNLLDFLWRNKHASPFEMCELAIEVQAPLFVFREWHRHRTQSYNEFSARYSEMPNLHYTPSETRFKANTGTNKQASGHDVIQDPAILSAMSSVVENEQNDIYDNYQWMLDNGTPKEVARINTPVSRYSKMRAKGNLRNWFNFLNLRMRPGAQYEIREYANAVSKIVSFVWPKAYSLFEEYDLFGTSFSRTEMKIIRSLLEQNDSLSKELGAGLTGRKKDEFVRKITKGGEEIL